MEAPPLDTLVKIAQVFAIPSTVLIPALNIGALKEPYKMMIAGLGLVLAVAWFFCNSFIPQPNPHGHERILTWMPVVLAGAWVVVLFFHLRWWWNSSGAEPSRDKAALQQWALHADKIIEEAEAAANSAKVAAESAKSAAKKANDAVTELAAAKGANKAAKATT